MNRKLTEEKMIKTYRSSKTIITKSTKGGNGLFAKENILPGEIIAIRAGQIVDTVEASKRDKEIGDYSLQISDEFYICPETRANIEDIALFINHSCDPNIGMDGQICFVAMRSVQAGEELCMDYAMAITGDYNMNCNCKMKNCRKVITGDDWKKKELQKLYGNYFSWFIYKKFAG